MTAQESYAEKDRVLAEVETAHAEALAAGLDIIERHATRGTVFSANSCRDELRAVGVMSASTGALFAKAVAAGIITPTGRYEMSTEARTRHRIATYEGTGAGYEKPAAKPQPVDETGAPSLFEISR